MMTYSVFCVSDFCWSRLKSSFFVSSLFLYYFHFSIQVVHSIWDCCYCCSTWCCLALCRSMLRLPFSFFICFLTGLYFHRAIRPHCPQALHAPLYLGQCIWSKYCDWVLYLSLGLLLDFGISDVLSVHYLKQVLIHHQFVFASYSWIYFLSLDEQVNLLNQWKAYQ